VLYGGTALVLRLGHRQSEDFDLFLPRRFDPNDLRRDVELLRDRETVQSAPDTLTVRIDGIRVSLFGVDIPSLEAPDVAEDIGLPVASLRDLGATKVHAVLGRAEARDYVDVAALLEHGLDLADMLGCAVTLFGVSFNPLLALKALTTFEEGTLPAVPEHVRKELREAAAQTPSIPVVGARFRRILPTEDELS
jgi:predicted nucleotidyltransferase component of viral defense system